MPDKFDPKTLPKDVREAYDHGPLAWPLVVQEAIKSGETRVDKLTDIVFHLHHPERAGEPIAVDQPASIEEWMHFRELIRPLVRYREGTEVAAGEGPLDGYVCSSFGANARERLGVAETRGCTSETGTRRKRLTESDILFLSGHHYALFGEPMHFDAIDLRTQKEISSRVRLIMVSSCRGLAGNSLRAFRKRFPSAYVFGWLGGSPKFQKGLMLKFLDGIGETVDISTASGIRNLIARWRQYIEDLPDGKGGVSQWGLGYASPTGDVEWWDGKAWHSR